MVRAWGRDEALRLGNRSGFSASPSPRSHPPSYPTRYIRHPMRKFLSKIPRSLRRETPKKEKLLFGSSNKEKGWQILKDVLRSVCACSDAFPPLKAALSAVLELVKLVEVGGAPVLLCLDIVWTWMCSQNVSGAQEGFYNAAEKIDRLRKILDKYASVDDSPVIVRERLDGVISCVFIAVSRLDPFV